MLTCEEEIQKQQKVRKGKQNPRNSAKAIYGQTHGYNMLYVTNLENGVSGKTYLDNNKASLKNKCCRLLFSDLVFLFKGSTFDLKEHDNYRCHSRDKSRPRHNMLK